MPRRIILEGDEQEAAKLIGMADSLLQTVRAMAKYRRLKQFGLSRSFMNGRINISAHLCFNLSTIRIYVAPGVVISPKAEEGRLCLCTTYLAFGYVKSRTIDNTVDPPGYKYVVSVCQKTEYEDFTYAVESDWAAYEEGQPVLVTFYGLLTLDFDRPDVSCCDIDGTVGPDDGMKLIIVPLITDVYEEWL